MIKSIYTIPSRCTALKVVHQSMNYATHTHIKTQTPVTEVNNGVVLSIRDLDYVSEYRVKINSIIREEKANDQIVA